MNTRNAWRILVVEDDPDGQAVVATILGHLRIDCDVAGDYDEAQAFLTTVSYNAVVVDLALPGKDGWELLHSVQTNPAIAGLPCIAVTAYHTSRLREQAIEAGFISYFPKPIDPNAFSRQLEHLLS